MAEKQISTVGATVHKRQNVRRRVAAFDQQHDVVGHRLHDVFIFIAVTVPVIDRRDAALDMVLNAVHRLAAKAERGNSGAVGPAQIVWRGAFDAKLGAGRSHGGVAASS